jgi:hypothetical protein
METFLTLLRRLQDEGTEPDEAHLYSWPVSKVHEREIVIRFDADDLEAAQRVFDDLERRRLRPRRSGDALTIVVDVHN